MQHKRDKILVGNTARAISLLLALILIFSVLSSCSLNEEPTKEDIAGYIESRTPTKATHVSDYLVYWDFPEFDETIIRNLESRYLSFYYKELPEQQLVAKTTAQLFLEHFFDEIDLKDTARVTSAIAACYIQAVGDKYGAYRTATGTDNYSTDLSGEHVGVGITVTKHDTGAYVLEVLDGSPAKEAGLLADDIIVSVDGTIFGDLAYESFVELVRGEAGTEVTLGVLRDGVELSFTMERKLVVHQTVSYKMMKNNIAYIEITEFKANTATLFKEALDAAKQDSARGVIFDLSKNPGGYVTSVCDALSLLVPSGTPIISFSNNTSAISATHGTALEPVDEMLAIPSVVICTESTASAGELFTAALRDYNDMELLLSSVVGRTTYKKGVMQSRFELGGGATVTLTTAYYMPPSGVGYDGIGVEPDVLIESNEMLISEAIAELERLIAS